MAPQDEPAIAGVPLTAFELPQWLVEPAVRSCRLFNTAIDFIFYDVPTLRAALAEKDAPMQAQGEKPPSRIIDFDALSDPEGSLLLIDATTAPYVHKYQSVKKFLESPYQETRDVDIATITGVGSSALGSAALAWDISVALEKPVLAIVPGYGVADVVLQALGGWFAFGLYDFLSSKTLIQTGLAKAAPETARIGRELAAKNRRTILREAEQHVGSKYVDQVLDGLYVIEMAMRHFFIRAEMGKNAGRKKEEVDEDYKQAAALAALVAPYRHARLSAVKLASAPNNPARFDDNATADELRAELMKRLEILTSAGLIDLQALPAPKGGAA